MTGERKNWFDKTASILEQNIRGVQLGLYGVAIGGLAVALISIKPFKKFVSVKDIPSSFIERRIRLNGKVVGLEITPTKPLLHIDHTPIIGRGLRSQGNGLPVSIAAIDMYPNATSWLQHVAVGKNVDFTLLKRNPDNISCIVSHKKDDLGMRLVSLGFASVSGLDTTLEKDKIYMNYYKKLLKAEDKAEKQGVGAWEGQKVSLWSNILRLLKLPTIKLPSWKFLKKR